MLTMGTTMTKAITTTMFQMPQSCHIALFDSKISKNVKRGYG
jgi:hypothetical protein